MCIRDSIESFINRTKTDPQVIDEDDAIKFYEELYAEFRMHTCDEDMQFIELYMQDGDALNEALYNEFVKLENEYEEARAKADEMGRRAEKDETRTVSTKVTQRDLSQHPDDIDADVSSPAEELQNLIVS